MIPPSLARSTLRKLPWRWIGAGVAALAVALLVWRIAAWREGYQKLGAAQKALSSEVKARASDRAAYETSLAASQAERERFAADLASVRAKFAALPIPAPKTITVVREVPIAAGQTTCPDSRIAPAFRLHWNAAASP